MATLDLEARAEAVPQARALVRVLLESWGEAELSDDVELVLTELLSNVVLHAPGPVRIVLERDATGVRLEVRDSSVIPPVRRTSGSTTTTGRGLNLVATLAGEWGVHGRADDEPGKSVWCVVPRQRTEQAAPDLDLDALLAAYDDEPTGLEVHVGDAPVGLLLAAKDHLDGLLRELALAAGADGLPHEVVQPMASAARRFAPARTQLRGLLTAALARADERVELVFRLPLELAESGEQYLQALRDADAFARDRRMLSLESPVEHRVLREWYVEGLVAGLRQAGSGQPSSPGPTFEQRLLRELRTLEQEQRAAQLGAQLQRVTARLAAQETVQDVARTAITEGMLALGATGGTLSRDTGRTTAPVAEVGADEGMGERYLAVSLRQRPAGPSTDALRTAQPVWVETREERDARYPHLAAFEPAVVALAALPLLVAGQVVGALRLSWPAPHLFSHAERTFLDNLAVQAGQALARADALQRLRSLRDELEQLMQAPGGISGTDLGLLRSLYEDAPVGIAVYDAQGRYLRVNAVIARANGRSAKDHVGRTYQEVGQYATAQDLADVQELLDRVLVDGRAVEQEVGNTGPHGVRSWRTSWFPVRDPEGAVQAAVVLAVDITAQRLAEGRTRLLASLGDRLGRDRSEAGVLAATAAAVVPALGDWVAVHLMDEHGRIWCPLALHHDERLSPALQQLFGRFPVTRDQPIGAGRVLATGRTQELPEVDESILAAIGGDDQEFLALMREVDLRSGAVVPLTAGDRVVGALSVARTGAASLAPEDVSVLADVGRRAGVALENVRALSTSLRLELALDAADIGSYEWDVREDRLQGDDRLFRVLDADPRSAETWLQRFFARVHPDDVEQMRTALERAVADVGELAVDYRILVRDGSVRWVEARGQALPGADGRTERMVGTVVDVTDRRDSSARAQRMLELMGDAFFSLDQEWRFTYVNREAERVMDAPRERLLGRVLWEALPMIAGTAFERSYREVVATGRPVRFEQWYAPLGRHFEVRAYPGPDGLSVYFADIGEHRATQAERDRALARLGLLNEIGAALTDTLDVDEALVRLAGLLVPALADLVSVDLRDSDDVRDGRGVVITSSDPAKAAALRQGDELLPRRHNPASAVYAVLHGAPLVHLAVTPERLLDIAVDPVQLELYQRLDMRSVLVVPLVVRGRVFGALSLIRTGDGAVPWDQDDITVAQEVGRRAGLMVDNAAQYTVQRAVAEGLQRSLLPELPLVAGVELAASYEPSSSAATVGGDWYDAFVLPDGGLGLVIGDVMGHDIAAAAAMGQLRSVLRTCAADGDPPAVVLDRLDRLVSSFAMADLATVVYARLDRRPDGTAQLTWANAGHPPPLLIPPQGPATFLEGGASIMIGASAGQVRAQAERVLPAGSTLLMFTDGLVELRGRDLDDQLEELALTAAELRREVAGPAQLCSRLTASVRRDAHTDGAAALALTLL